MSGTRIARRDRNTEIRIFALLLIGAYAVGIV